MRFAFKIMQIVFTLHVASVGYSQSAEFKSIRMADSYCDLYKLELGAISIEGLKSEVANLNIGCANADGVTFGVTALRSFQFETQNIENEQLGLMVTHQGFFVSSRMKISEGWSWESGVMATTGSIGLAGNLGVFRTNRMRMVDHSTYWGALKVGINRQLSTEIGLNLDVLYHGFDQSKIDPIPGKANEGVAFELGFEWATVGR